MKNNLIIPGLVITLMTGGMASETKTWCWPTWGSYNQKETQHFLTLGAVVGIVFAASSLFRCYRKPQMMQAEEAHKEMVQQANSRHPYSVKREYEIMKYGLAINQLKILLKNS